MRSSRQEGKALREKDMQENVGVVQHAGRSKGDACCQDYPEKTEAR